MSDMPVFERYPFNVDPLPEEEGGGFAITFPDLPGCISDGETVEQAIAHGREAFNAWMESMLEDHKTIPGPNGVAEPAKFVLRLPRTLHSRLTSRASAEGVSLNSLVQTYVAEGLGRTDMLARSHEDPTIERFQKDPQLAAEYLDAIPKEGAEGELLQALQRMSKAFGG